MKDIIQLIQNVWYKEDGASNEQVRNLEESIGFPLPEDYREFLQWSNGGEGEIGEKYVKLWSSDDIVQRNGGYMIPYYMPGFIGIGTDGGSRCYAFDFRTYAGSRTFIEVDLGGLSLDTFIVIGASFRTGIERLLKT
ncbi:MAG: SMI1/KNR4 family protein [Armatimonadota bacterium]|nr:SMI1/KNR4 family protein [Armatimonadota bacterium]